MNRNRRILAPQAAWTICAIALLASGLSAAAQAQKEPRGSKKVVMGPDIKADLKLVPSGVAAQVGYFIRQRIRLSSSRPDNVKTEPQYRFKPLYGVFRFGAARDADVAIALDEAPDGSYSALYVDSNGNGDLTDDPPAKWTKVTAKTVNSQTGAEHTLVEYEGSASVTGPKVPGPNGLHYPEPSSLVFRRLLPETAQLLNQPDDIISYHRDYGRFGKIALGKKTYNIGLLDEDTSGRYDDVEHPFGRPPRVALLIDRNGDGRFDPRFERYDVKFPFNIDGATYRVTRIESDGSQISIARTNERAAEIPFPVPLAVGKTAPQITRKAIDGAEVRFPDGYRGKIVLVLFWAMWSQPSMNGLPEAARAYAAYHDRGFEIIGVNGDDAGAWERVRDCARTQGMTWPQIMEAGSAQPALVDAFGIYTLPMAFLVDGTTGKILAEGEELSGSKLDDTLRKFLPKSR